MLKKFVALVFLLLFLGVASLTEASATLTILYTGDTRGNINPCDT